jgi:hypothetical protein
LHCMIAWGVSQGGVPLTLADHEAIESDLAGQDWLRVFPGVVVITLEGDAQRLALEQKLTALSKERFNSRLLFVMSPPMQSGSGIYRGFLPQPVWEPLNKKTV